MLMSKSPLKMAVSLIAMIALSSCGGGSTSSNTPTSINLTPPPTVGTQAPVVPNFVANEFPASSDLRALCQVVRTDRDLNGNARPDRQGELLHELFWLRSWMNETYLFFDEVMDSDPNNFTDVPAYFDELLTTTSTASGAPTDRFSFLQTTEDFETRSSGAPTFGYGASFAVLNNSVPRDWRVSFTQSGSPAESVGLTRGARILTIDGTDFVNGGSQADIDTLVAGLFPESVGETHVFGVRYPDGTETDITIESTSLAIEPVNLERVIQQNGQRIGYLHFNSFGPRTGERQLIDSFERFAAQEVDDLVLDLRYNGGGLLFLSAQLGYMIAGVQSEGRIFYSQEFNSRDPGRNPLSGERVSPITFQSETLGFTDDVTPGQDLPTLNLNRVFVLTTDRSCSASEAVMNGLIGIGVEPIQIGTRTCGKATGQIPTENCGLTFVPLHFRGVNANGFGDYDGGFAPGQVTGDFGPLITGCEVNDDFSRALGDTEEAQLATAINFAQTGNCGTNASAKTQIETSAKFSLIEDTDPLYQHPRMKSLEKNFGVLDFTGIDGQP